MTAYEKLSEILRVENINIDIKQDISWISIERILKHKRLEKYCIWLMTGKILPEAGQISPALAHDGHMITIC